VYKEIKTKTLDGFVLYDGGVQALPTHIHLHTKSACTLYDPFKKQIINGKKSKTKAKVVRRSSERVTDCPSSRSNSGKVKWELWSVLDGLKVG